MDEAMVLSSHSAADAHRTRPLDIPVALGAWAALVGVAITWGRSLAGSGAGIAINAPPLFGRYDVRISMKLLPAVIVAAAAVVYLPKLVSGMKFSRLLALSVAASFVWAVSLALIDGPDGLIGALESRFDYLSALPSVGQPLSFLSAFTDSIASYPVHVRSHPPGMLLFLWSLDAIGASGAWWAASAIVLAGASATAAVLLTVRELVGEKSARVCAPFVIIGPSAIWIATSADALFMAISAWGIALFALATGRRDLAGYALAGGAGLVLGASLFFSYGVAPLALVVGVVAVMRRRVRPLVVAAAGVTVTAAAFGVFGFWWPAGLGESIQLYNAGIAARRPYGFFLLNNLAAFAVVLGPAMAVALTRLKDRRLWLIVGAALVGTAAANLSGLSKGEVERIWLPFVPWVGLATVALKGSRRWLGVQAGAALAIAVLIRAPW